MQLSAEQFEAVVHSIQFKTAPESTDLRRQPRAQIRGNVTIILLESDRDPKPTSVGVTDVSPLGIGLILNRSLEIGQQFILCMSYVGADNTRAIICTVRHRQALDRGHFLIGCEFAQASADLPTDELVTGLGAFQLNDAEMESAAASPKSGD